MWPITYSKWEECWLVGEFSREIPEQFDSKGQPVAFIFFVDAVTSCLRRNTNNKKSGEEYDQGEALEDASSVWPGGAVQYGVSYG